MCNKWNVTSLTHNALYVVPVFFITFSSSWGANNDTIVADGTVRVIENLVLENSTSGSFVLKALNGAELTTSGLTLNSSGLLGGAIWIEDSTFNAQDLLINVTGSNGDGIYIANASNVTMSNVTLNGQSSAKGLVLDGNRSNTSGVATVNVSDSVISTQSGDAIRAMSGDLTLNNVTASTSGDNSYAVNANVAADITIEGGTYTTQGEGSDGIWAASSDSSVSVNNAVITTTGDSAKAANIQSGTANMTNTVLETQGTESYGLYTENQVQGDNLTIITGGDTGIGVFVARGGVAQLTNSTITTSGAIAAGLLVYPGSSITADNVDITTSGENAFGLWDKAGTLSVSNSQITTQGVGAAGLYVDGYSTTLANQVSLNNVTLTSAQAQGISVNTTNLTLDVTDSEITGGNGDVMTVSHYSDSADSSNTFYSTVTLNADSSTLNGDIVVDDIANTVAINLNNNSVLNGAITNASSVALDSTSTWNLSNNSIVGQLTNNGTIIFTRQDSFDTLNILGDYYGDGGLLVMNSVLGDDSSPANKLIITGDVADGTTGVAVNNLGGYGAQTVEGIEIISVGGTSYGSFVKTGRIVAGAYDYDVVKKGESWYLTSYLTTPTENAGADSGDVDSGDVITGNADGVASFSGDSSVRPEAGSYADNLASANTMFVMSLHDRLGEPQFIDALADNQDVTSLWLRQVGLHGNWSDNSSQLKTQSNRYVAQLGGDIAQWSTDGQDRWHLGFMGGYANARSRSVSSATDYNSKGSVKGYSVGSYATWYANNADKSGGYLDSWVQYSWFDNDVSGEGLATESYKSKGFTASLEGGYTWKLGDYAGSLGTRNSWFVQPQAQIVWMGISADDHRESNGTVVQGKGDGNLMTRLGARTYLQSHHARDAENQREFQPYLELNWLHNTRNFATSLDGVYISQTGARNLGEAKVGLEGQINPRLNLWGNIGVRVGDAGYNDSAAMVGVKYNF